MSTVNLGDYVLIPRSVLALVTNALERDKQERPVRGEILEEIEATCLSVNAAILSAISRVPIIKAGMRGVFPEHQDKTNATFTVTRDTLATEELIPIKMHDATDGFLVARKKLYFYDAPVGINAEK
jgi:hypothetical protein